jgi:hypothetical protein
MARPKRIYEKCNRPYRKDWELVESYQLNLIARDRAKKEHTKKAYQEYMDEFALELWDKYFLLRMKMRAELAKVVRESNLHYPELYEEYDSEAWEKFINALPKVRFDELELKSHTPESWNIWIMLWGYWRSMNRDLLKKWFDNYDYNKTVPIYSLTKNDGKGSGGDGITNLDVHISKGGNQVESGHEVNEAKLVFHEALDKLKSILTKQQKDILKLKAVGTSDRGTMKVLKIRQKELTYELDVIKGQLNCAIEDVSKQKGLEFNYRTLSKVLEG